jgi:2-haloacid dehalogenase
MDSRRISVVIFDADNTLFDFDMAQRSALLETIGLGEKDPDSDEAFALFKEVNDQAWKEHEEGILSRDVLRVERFRRYGERRPFARGLEDAAEFYLDALSTKGELYPGAREALEELRGRGFRLALATNGFTRVQRGRIAAAKVESLFEGIYISEEMGMKKPDASFFAACLAGMGCEPFRALMVGDSPAADMAGAKAAGMPCAWINSHRAPYPPEFPSPDMELRSVNELPRALGIGL